MINIPTFFLFNQYKAFSIYIIIQLFLAIDSYNLLSYKQFEFIFTVTSWMCIIHFFKMKYTRAHSISG